MAISNRTQGTVEQYTHIYIHTLYTFPRNVSDAHLLKAWEILEQKNQPSAIVGKKDLLGQLTSAPRAGNIDI